MAAAEGALQQRRAAAMEKARQLIIERALEAELLAEDVEEPIRTFFVPSVTDIATGQPLPSQPSEVEPARSFG